MFRYLPEQASDFAHKVDWIHHLITDISVFFTVAIVGSMIYFAIRYRRVGGVDHDTPQIKGSHFLEVLWTVVPSIICVVVAYYGALYFKEMRNVPSDALSVNVRGSQWSWDFEYENGKKTTGELIVPVDMPVQLIMTAPSTDVLHSFFVPAMRVKNDVVPGRYTNLWFRPIKTGVFNAFCTEYCGKDHSKMLAKVKVVSQAEYKRWINDKSEELAKALISPAERAKPIYQTKCASCHTLDGTPGIGPSFLKLYGKEEKLSDGTTVKVDENYLKRSIEDPDAQIVAGFPKAMQPFAGLLTEQEIQDLISFIKSIQEPPKDMPKKETVKPKDAKALAAMTPAERGKEYYQAKLCISCHSLDGALGAGPSFKGLFGKKGKLQDGTVYEGNEAYITESIKDPTSKVVESFTPSMPAGLLNDEEIKDMLEFLKTVK